MDDLFREPSRPEPVLPSTSQNSNHSVQRDLAIVHGTASVRDGQVIVTDPINDGSYATIVIPENPLIQVYVNGERVEGETVVSRSHIVDIQFSSIQPRVSYDVVVSDDELSVSVRANVVKGVELHLKDDRVPKRRLKLEIEEVDRYPNPASPAVILDLLYKNGFHGVIDYPAIHRLCTARGTQQEVVLRGSPPRQGKPANLRLSTSFQTERDSLFRTVRLPKVAIGTTCAVIEPGFEGVPGVNVYGVPILPASTTPHLPRLGDGVTDVNGDIVAIREGRLVYTKHRIDVVPELIFERNLSSDDGKIEFDGNIVVHGSIRNGAIVKASGAVIVYGDIETSSVIGGQGVLVGEGIYGSTVISGHHQIVYDRLLQLLNRMIPELSRFGHEYALMIAHAIKRFDAHTTIPKIPGILFEKRHKRLAQMVEQFVDEGSVELSNIDPIYRDLRELIETTWSRNYRQNVSQKDCEIFLDKLIAFRRSLESSPTQRTVVHAKHVASSTIRSVGNIVVKCNCYSSNLESGNTVAIQQALRGGFVIARKSVYVTELGSPLAVETSVRVEDFNGFIRAQVNHPNTLLEVHGRRVRTYNTERNIRYGGSLQYDQDRDRR